MKIYRFISSLCKQKFKKTLNKGEINRYFYIVRPLLKNKLLFYFKLRLSAFRKYISFSCNTNKICTIVSLYASIRHYAYSPFKPELFHQRQWLKYDIYSIGCISNLVLLTKSYKMSGHMALFDKIIFSIQQKYQLGTQFWSETQH